MRSPKGDLLRLIGVGFRGSDFRGVGFRGSDFRGVGFRGLGV